MARSRQAAVLMLSAVLGSALVVGAASPASAKVEPGTFRGGEVTKVGWWWVANQPPAETGLVAFPQERPPNVPKGSLPVAAAGGDPEKLSAIELRLATKPGAMVESATLVLQESTSPGANANAENAKILACPITEAFWADGTAARWSSQPEYDCDTAQAAGVRDEKGRWTFDLTSLASGWLTEGATGSPSFVLVEGVEAPESFQVSFDGTEAKGIGFAATYIPAPKGGATTGGSAGAGSGSDGLGGTVGGSSTGSLSGGSSGGSLDSGSLSGGDVPMDGAPVDGGTAVTTDPVDAGTVPVAAPAVVHPWYSGMPKATFLLLPFALGLAYLAMLALGPDAQPTVHSSQHGVSRALEKLRLAGAQAIAGVRR